MLQRLIYSARINVFESARFYYLVLLALTFHLIVRHSLIKILLVNEESEFLVSRIITGILYAAVYGTCVISAFLMRRQISKLFLYPWLIITCISLFNEIIFYLGDPYGYNLIHSISSGQGFSNIRITISIIFLGVWQALNNCNYFSKKFLKLMCYVTLMNSVLVCFGVFFEISIFESYPLSGRWGYSGLLSRGYSVILSSIVLIDLLKKGIHLFSPRSILLIISLICSGQKAGLLSIMLIIYLIIIKSKKYRLLIFGIFCFLLITINQWGAKLISLNSFWSNVYENHGIWGVLFSLRNENLLKLHDHLISNYSLLNWFLGGKIRHEDLYVEMLLFDFFVYYGLFGTIVLSYFFIKFINSFKWSVPLLVSIFSGQFITGSFVVMFYGIWIMTINRVGK